MWAASFGFWRRPTFTSRRGVETRRSAGKPPKRRSSTDSPVILRPPPPSFCARSLAPQSQNPVTVVQMQLLDSATARRMTAGCVVVSSLVPFRGLCRSGLRSLLLPRPLRNRERTSLYRHLRRRTRFGPAAPSWSRTPGQRGSQYTAYQS